MTGNWPDSARVKAVWRRVGLEGLAGVLGLVALGVGLVSTVLQRWVPVSDMALIELRVRDVPFHLPLVGAYSRFGWSHPGPAQYLLLSVPYRLTGAASWSIPAATLLMNMAAVGVAWRIARKVDRLAGGVVLLGAMILVAGGDPELLRSWWNPYVGVILTFTLIVAAWGCAERRAWPTFFVLPVASLLIQSHIGYAAVAVPVAVAGLALMASPRSDSEDERAGCWRHAVGGAALAAVMWLPPLIEQFRSDPGNLAALLRSGTGSGEPAGIGFALRLLLENLGIPPVWAGRVATNDLDTLTPTWVPPVLLLIPIGAIALAIWRRSRPELRALTVASAGTVGAIIGTTYVHGDVYSYLVPWFAPTIAALITISSWVLLANLPATARTRAGQAVAIATVALAGLVAVQQVPAAEFDPGTADAVRDLSSALISDADGRQVFINSQPDFITAAAYPGVVLAAERSGLDVRVPETESGRVGTHRTGPVDGRVEYLMAQPQYLAQLRSEGWKVVAIHDPFTSKEEREIGRLRTEADRLRHGPESPESDRARDEVIDQIIKKVNGRITAVLLRR